MKHKYKQLNLAQRYKIEALLEAEQTQTAIATLLQVNKSTISRELSRNIGSRGRCAGVYNAARAERKTANRHKAKIKSFKLTDELKSAARDWLITEKLSPELISYKWKEKGIAGVSHETLYKWIWEAKSSHHRKFVLDSLLYKELRHGKRRRKRGNYKDTRGSIKNRVPMSERPSCVETRERIGDLEVDLMMGAHHKSALLVITDRATLITGIEKLESKNAALVSSKIIEKLSRFDSSWVKTITFDNGKEFSQHEKIAKALNAKSYFTRPYTSQDKGTVENRIGVIRRFFPKKTDLREISHQKVREVERMINIRPVRKFNYLSPVQKLKTKCVALIS
jgi:IS30 family transposase